MERLVASSGRGWSIVRPPYLSNGPTTGRVRSQTGRKDLAHGPYHISRGDLADTLLDLAEDSQHLGEVLLVSERKEGDCFVTVREASCSSRIRRRKSAT